MNAPAIRPLATLPRQLARSAVAVIGTVVYAGSFILLDSPTLAWASGIVGIAAGFSWPILGGVLVTRGRRWTDVATWVDVCLSTMVVGIAVLLAAVVLNLMAARARWPVTILLSGHAAILIVSNAAMARVFVRQSAAIGVPVAMAWRWWALGLCLPFAVVVAAVSVAGAWS
ncbi:MAG: hypothetical protein WD042_17885 [Phycisphaeraceae bacterium]